MFELVLVTVGVLIVLAVAAVVFVIAESRHRAFYARQAAKFSHLR